VRLDGKPYGWYADLVGRFAFPARGDLAGFMLHVDAVQPDPFAPPSRLRVRLTPRAAGFPERLWSAPARRVALGSWLARRFALAARARAQYRGGPSAGPSGAIVMTMPTQQVLPQTAVLVGDDGGLEARFTVALPDDARRVAGRRAEALLLEDVPAIVDAALRGASADLDAAWEAVAVHEDAEALRAEVVRRGLVAFVADGSILPRRAGNDDRPLAEGAVPFEAPEALAVTLEAPHAGPLRGMAVPPGVTVIVGGAFHGKSTLLRALEMGVYNHRPGDGRERCVTAPDAVKVRAEDGRSVAGVDIAAFVADLPGGADPRRFATQSASGATSQAAAIVEALEMGAGALLIDEDTAATNFMIRDRRMQALVPDELEPVTPFVDRVRGLHAELGVSTVVVVGGSGDYLDVADTVVAMRHWQPHDATEEAAAVARALPTGRATEAAGPLVAPAARRLAPGCVDARRGRNPKSARARGRAAIELGTQTIDVAALSQIASPAQARAIAQALAVLAGELAEGPRTVRELVDDLAARAAARGLDVLEEHPTGDLAGFRRHELAAALNRLRTLVLDAVRRPGDGEDDGTTAVDPAVVVPDAAAASPDGATPDEASTDSATET